MSLKTSQAMSDICKEYSRICYSPIRKTKNGNLNANQNRNQRLVYYICILYIYIMVYNNLVYSSRKKKKNRKEREKKKVKWNLSCISTVSQPLRVILSCLHLRKIHCATTSSDQYEKDCILNRIQHWSWTKKFHKSMEAGLFLCKLANHPSLRSNYNNRDLHSKAYWAGLTTVRRIEISQVTTFSTLKVEK